MAEHAPSIRIHDDIIDGYLSVYEKYMGLADISWDDEAQAWFATGRDVCFDILVNGKEFDRIDRFLPEGKDFWGGHRSILILEGTEHRRLHQAEMRRRSEEFAAETVGTITRSIASTILATVDEDTPFELAHDYCNELSLKTGLTYMGFPADDNDWIAEVLEWARVRDTWKAKLLMGLPADEDTVPGLEAIARLKELFLPTIRARQAHPENDLLSHMWEKGPEIFEDWNENDMVDGCWSDYIGGETPYLMRNAVHVLLEDPDLAMRLRRDPSLTPDFVEECLRCLSPLTMLLKRAMKDVEKYGVHISEGDRIWVLPGVANIKDVRAKGDDRAAGHLAFGQGIRYCTGRYVARSEVETAVNTLLETFSTMGPAEGAPKAEWTGVVMRSAEPLHATLTR